MKRVLILLSIGCACIAAQAQTPQATPAMQTSQTAPSTAPLLFSEPEFVGHALAILPGDKTKPLAQESVTPRHRASTGAKLFGIGRTHISEMALKGPKAPLRFNNGEGIAFIIRVIDNQMDPMTELSIFRFKTTKKLRIAEYASVGTLGDR